MSCPPENGSTMDAYHPKRRITLSFAGWKGCEYVAAAFGGDSLRQRLMQDSKSFTKKLTEYHELCRQPVWLSEHVPSNQFSELHLKVYRTTFCRRTYYLGDGWRNVPKDIRKEAQETAYDKWRLLLQLDTVECGDFCLMFGDC